MRTFSGCFAAGGMGLLVAAAAAQPADLAVDENASSISAELCITPSGLSTRCDADDSPVAGMVQIELDSYGAPAAITLHDFQLALTETMSYHFNWGFLVGTLDITLEDVTAVYATPGQPTGPVSLDGSSFEFPSVATLLAGTGTYVGAGPIMGTLVGSGTFDLADAGPVASAFAGDAFVQGDLVILTADQTFFVEGDVDGASYIIDGAATLFAAGDVPPPDCRADLNGDTVVNTQDFAIFLNLWAAGDPLADWNGDGVVNTLDFAAYLNDWAAGC